MSSRLAEVEVGTREVPTGRPRRRTSPTKISKTLAAVALAGCRPRPSASVAQAPAGAPKATPRLYKESAPSVLERRTGVRNAR